MSATSAFDARIQAIEQRLENRRTRMRVDADEAQTAAIVAARRWLPVAAAAGAGLAALWLARRMRPASRALPVASALAGAATGRRGVRWASLLGLASSAYKLGTRFQAGRLLANDRRRGR